jgi:hypothetical protein
MWNETYIFPANLKRPSPRGVRNRYRSSPPIATTLSNAFPQGLLAIKGNALGGMTEVGVPNFVPASSPH